jgi:hypothetical protein
MPYVMRNKDGAIVALSPQQVAGCDEELAADDDELTAFLSDLGNSASSLGATDQGFIRVLEDLVDVLVDKGVISFSDLPEDAQGKITHRRHLRSALRGR